MNDFIAKPIEPVDLFTKLLRWVAGGRPRGGAPATSGPRGDAPAELDVRGIAGLDVEGALGRLLGRRSLYQQLVRQFAYGDMAGAAATVAAQVKAGDPEAARRTAHSLKGVAGMLGAEELQRRALALESALRDNAAPATVESLRVSAASELDRLVGALRALVPPESVGGSDAAGAVGALPGPVREAMRRALKAGDLQIIEDRARAAAVDHPQAAEAILRLCAAFDYDGLEKVLSVS